MPERALRFDIRGVPCVGILHEPAVQRIPELGVVIVVGGPQYRVGSHRQFLHLARELAVDCPVLRFDVRGMGDSEGEERSFLDLDEDIRAAVDALVALRPDVRRVVLWGLCDGANAIMRYVSGDDRIAGIAIANPWVRTESGHARSMLEAHYRGRLVSREFLARLFTGKVDVLGAARSFVATWSRARSDALEEGADYVAETVAALLAWNGRVLWFDSLPDATGTEFRQLVAGDPRLTRRLSGERRVELPEADHTFSAERDSRLVERETRSWIEQWGGRGCTARADGGPHRSDEGTDPGMQPATGMQTDSEAETGGTLR